jgi:hypothetical protein
MEFVYASLLCLVVLVAVAGVLLFIFKDKVPDPYQKYLKWVWIAFATIFSLGGYLLIRKKEPEPRPVEYERPIIKLDTPDPEEVESLDNRVDDTLEEIEKIEEESDKIDTGSGRADPALLDFMDDDS